MNFKSKFFHRDTISYKKNMPDDESRLKTLKDALNELIRKATNNGVPKDIRGE